MKTKKSRKADLENKRSTFFLVGLVLSLSVVLFAFEWKTSETNETIKLGTTNFAPVDFDFIPPTREQKKEPPKPIVKVPQFEIVDDQTDIKDELIDFSSEGEDKLDIDFNDLIYQPSEAEEEKPEEILITAEIMPEFPGGTKALWNYLSKNVNYPVIAQENGIQGKVFVSFVVDEVGNISDARVIRGVDIWLNNEALRVVNRMPKWQPGRQGGKAVKVRYNVPINFQLQ